MHASEVTPEATREANELYWGSDRSVNQIADQLDLSKGALYGIIEPQPTGSGCPMCGDEVVYANRTAKERDMLQCPTCEWEGSSDEAVDFESIGTGRSGAKKPAPTPKAARSTRPRQKVTPEPSPDIDSELAELDDDVDALTPLLTPRMRTIAGGALIGAAVGLTLVLWARRQR